MEIKISQSTAEEIKRAVSILRTKKRIVDAFHDSVVSIVEGNELAEHANDFKADMLKELPNIYQITPECIDDLLENVMFVLKKAIENNMDEEGDIIL